jgi:hypothetical protein
MQTNMAFVFGPYTISRRQSRPPPVAEQAGDMVGGEVGEMMRQALLRADVLREELMRATWRPDRVRRWCLEYDDEFFDDSPSPPKPDPGQHAASSFTSPGAASSHTSPGAASSHPRKHYLGCQQLIHRHRPRP